MPNKAQSAQPGNQYLMGFDASQRTDLIYPPSFMGWQSERLTFLPERIWIANILQSAGRRKEGVLTRLVEQPEQLFKCRISAHAHAQSRPHP